MKKRVAYVIGFFGWYSFWVCLAWWLHTLVNLSMSFQWWWILVAPAFIQLYYLGKGWISDESDSQKAIPEEPIIPPKKPDRRRFFVIRNEKIIDHISEAGKFLAVAAIVVAIFGQHWQLFWIIASLLPVLAFGFMAFLIFLCGRCVQND